MNEIVIYSTIMFWAGVLLTKAVFFFEQKRQQKNFYLKVSLIILQILDSVHSAHQASVQSAAFELKKIENLEESVLQKYLEKESGKVGIFMELYTLLFLKAVPEKGRKYVNYRSWTEASSLIQQLRGLTNNGENER